MQSTTTSTEVSMTTYVKAISLTETLASLGVVAAPGGNLRWS